jgi:hypothetical protein
MLDKVYILKYTNAGTTDEHGTPDISYVSEGTPRVCSLDDKRTLERLQTAQVKTVDAVIRFADEIPDITPLDRIELIERIGKTIDPSLIYAIDGEIERGPFGTVCNLKILTGVDNA